MDLFSYREGVQFGFLVGKPEVSYTVGNLSNSQKLDKDAYAAFDFGVRSGIRDQL